MEVHRDVPDLLAVAHALRIAQIPLIIPAEDVLALLAVHHAQHIAETLPIIQEGDAQDPHVAQTVDQAVIELVQLIAQIIVETVVHQTVEKDVPIPVELVADANAIGRVVVHVTSNVRLVV